MNARCLIVLIAAVLCVSTAAAGGPQGLRKGRRQMSTGMPTASLPVAAQIQKRRYREAIHQLETDLGARPDDPELFAMLGSAWSRLGIYADAAGAFALSAGSAWYLRSGFDDEADTLRAFGKGRQAADLRLEARWDDEKSISELVVLQGAANDLREAGDLEEAEDLALEAFAAYPAAGLAYATLAEVALDMGDRDEAEFNLWCADRRGYSSSALHAVRARIALSDGDFDTAERESRAAFQGRSRSRTLLALRAEVLRRRRLPELALRLIDGPRGGMQEEPVLLAVQAASLFDLGDTERAREIVGRALVVYPESPDVQRAAAYVGR